MLLNASKTFGCYYPSFLRMKLDTLSLEEIKNAQGENLRTFFHEYIHFYQDVCTIYGLQNIVNLVDILASMNNAIFQNNVFDTPIIIGSETVTGKNIDLHSLYLGEINTRLNFDWEILSIETEPNELIDGYKDVESVVVKYKSSGKSSEFYFGSFCILESMAHELENHVFGYLKTNEFPYNTARRLFLFHFLDSKFTETETSKYVAVFCDLALDSFHPGFHYVKLLQHFQSIGLPEISDIYKYASGLVAEFNGNQQSSDDIRKYFSDLSISQMGQVINKSSHSDLLEWVSDTIASGEFLRREINFILELCEKDSAEGKLFCFNKTHNFLGTPIVVDKHDDLDVANSRHDIGGKSFYLIGVFSIYNLFRISKPECDLKSNCRKSIPDIFDEAICTNKPWEQVKKSTLCPYAQVWKTWGHEKKTPIIKPQTWY